MAFSDDQVTQALRESMAQGFSLEDSLWGAANKFGVSQDQLDRVKGAFGSPAQTSTFTSAPATTQDTIANLRSAGLQEQDEGLNTALYGSPYTQNLTSPAAITGTAQAMQKAREFDPSKPQDLIRTLTLNDPNALSNLSLNQMMAYGQGEASTYYDPGMDVAGFNVRSTGDGFEALKKSTAPNTDQLRQMGLSGRPVETKYTYDAEGNITGSEARYFKGGDSGILVRMDASGNPIDARSFDYSEDWKGAVLPIANIALMALAGPATGQLTSALTPTLGTTFAPIAAQTLVGAGRGAVLGGLTGQDVGQSALRGGIAAGAGAGISNLGELAGKNVGSFVGNLVPQTEFGDLLTSLSGNVARDVVKQVGGSLVGSALTGRDFDLGSAVAGGALSGLSATVFDEVKSNPAVKALPKELQGAALAALSAQLRGRDPGPAAVNALVGSIVKQIGREVSANLPSGGGGSGEAQGIWEGWDPSGGEGIPISGDQRVEVGGGTVAPDTTSIEELVSDVLRSMPRTEPNVFAPTPSVSVIAPKLQTGDQFLDELIADSVKFTPKPKDQVIVPGKRIPPESGGVPTAIAEDQRVNVPGSRTPSESVGVTAPRFPVEPSEPVETDGTPRVNIIAPKFPIEPSEPIATPPFTPITPPTTPPTLPPLPKVVTPPSRPPTTPGTGSRTTVTRAPSRGTPIPEERGQAIPPALANVFYAGAVEFGPDGQSMADPTDFQGRIGRAKRSLELALDGEGGENQADDAYERLMALVRERPADTIEELMQIIGRG